MAGSATVGFYLKYGPEMVPMHLLLLGFLLYSGVKYTNPQLWVTLGLIGFYTLTHEKLYIG